MHALGKLPSILAKRNQALLKADNSVVPVDHAL